MSTHYKVVVYGGDLPAVFAAAKASAEIGISSTPKVCLIVPYPETRYKNSAGTWVSDTLIGGIMAAGGLNYWDDKSDSSGNLYTKGSYYYFKDYLGCGFNRVALSDYCKHSLSNNNVTIYESLDIYTYTTTNNPRKISSVRLCQIERDASGKIIWSDPASSLTITGDVFIDASTDGRLARTENSVCTVGRYDWPENYLTKCEVLASDYIGRQQAATLMIKMRIPNPPNVQRYLYPGTNKVSAFWTTSTEYKDASGPIVAFNKKYMCSDHIIIKPSNVARDGIDSNEWWVNGFLIFDVDGRSFSRDDDAQTVFKVERKFKYKTTDEAWITAKSFIKNHKTEIETAFQYFNGFSGATIIFDDHNEPVVGDMLYIRESVHMSKLPGSRIHNSESNYQITKDEVRTAGATPTTGSDAGNYSRRIGVGFYFCDIHPYRPCDLVNSSGGFLWGTEAAANMRSDAIDPNNPVYIPFEALRTNYVANLLIPGYAANISSYAWGEMRVFSNLSVLGDAAGIIAGYCCNNSIEPYNMAYNTTHMQAVQSKILAVGGRLEK